MDVVGGYSKELEEKMSKLVVRKGIQVLVKMQKAVISGSFVDLEHCAYFQNTFVVALINLVGTIKLDYHIIILKPMTHGSTSCNICGSTNVEPSCTDVLNGIEQISIFLQNRSTTFNA